MKFEIIRPQTSPTPSSSLHQIEVRDLIWRHGVSEDVAKRIVAISRTIDQADAIAELMK